MNDATATQPKHLPEHNYLLAALTPEERARVFPHLRLVSMPLGKVLYESDDALEYVYFPTNSIVSLLYVLESGASAEISVVGNEGLIGIALFMGGGTTPSRAIVQSAGHAYRLGGQLLVGALRDIADELDMHESTVSRVTNNKFIATPLGVFELKHFFSRAMVTASGNACSGTAIRGLIQDMIESEAAQAPLSDAEIARQLARQGLTVARRTVTKYRQLLRIESVERRRRPG